MNMFDAELVRDGDKYCVKLNDFTAELSKEKTERLLAKDVQSQPVTLGVRPEHVELAKKGVDATVDVSEMMGSEVHLHVNVEGKDAIIIVPTLDLESSDFKMGDKVTFNFGGNVAHIFSKEDEKNLEW